MTVLIKNTTKKATSDKSKNQSVPKFKPRYIRFPVDATIDQLFSQLKSENPFFSELDIVRFILGKFARQNEYQLQPESKFDNVFGQLKELHKDTPPMTEDQIFKILENNDLM